jgi:hypothetical protein
MAHDREMEDHSLIHADLDSVAVLTAEDLEELEERLEEYKLVQAILSAAFLSRCKFLTSVTLGFKIDPDEVLDDDDDNDSGDANTAGEKVPRGVQEELVVRHTLREIDLSRQELGGAGAITLLRFLPLCHQLRNVNVLGNMISPNHARNLVHMKVPYTILVLYSHYTHTILTLYSHCTRTILTLYSHYTPSK